MLSHRREFLRTAAALSASIALVPRWSVAEGASHKYFDIESIERTTVEVPYREIPARHMARELPHWKYSEIFQVRLKSGVTGIGETLLYYTWGATDDEDVRRAEGKNAVELLWDDSLGAGLQMALFDAVAKTAEVPIHRLLGQKRHDTTPLSWWNIDTSAEDMAAECQEALRKGYRSYKTKGRPWFDLWEQVEQATAVVPPEFKIDMDYNDTLLTAEQAIPILVELEKYPQIDIYETPIPQKDVEGNRKICEATRVHVALHYGDPDPAIALSQPMCDGFVIGGGARRLLAAGSASAAVDRPFWLQLVGTGITAAFSLHFGGVLSHAQWPAVNCHQLYEHDLLADPIEVVDGYAKVPDGVGLGHEVDWDVVEKYRVAKPPRRPEPERLLETRWPDGRRMYVANTGKVNFMLTVAQQGAMPFFERGVVTELLPDDGSDAWRKLYERARRAPVFEPA